VLLQVVLALLALIDLARRRHVANFPKWLWAIIILFGSMIGPILYFAIGRSAQTPVWEPPDDVDVETAASRQQQIRRAVDDLYDEER
jgi:membrane protein DedA with SNARE-associated domain